MASDVLLQISLLVDSNFRGHVMDDVISLSSWEVTYNITSYEEGNQDVIKIKRA